MVSRRDRFHGLCLLMREQNANNVRVKISYVVEQVANAHTGQMIVRDKGMKIILPECIENLAAALHTARFPFPAHAAKHFLETLHTF